MNVTSFKKWANFIEWLKGEGWISFFPQAVGICKDLNTSDEFINACGDVTNLGSLKCNCCCCRSYSSSDLWVHVLMWFKVFSRKLYYEIWMPCCLSVTVVGKGLAFEHVFSRRKARVTLTWSALSMDVFKEVHLDALVLDEINKHLNFKYI